MQPDRQSAIDSTESVTQSDSGNIVVLGKIVGPYGLRGAVRVHPFADDPRGWSKLPYWWLGREGEATGLWQRTRVLACKVHNESLIASLECLPDRTASEAVHGVLIGVPREALPATADDEYYWADLLGLAVTNQHGQSLGRVLGLIETSANDVLRVGDGEAAERLLPFVASVVREVDVGAGRILVEWELDW